jgi:hypothetical protein
MRLYRSLSRLDLQGRALGQGRPFFGKNEFAYDPERDLYTCPAGEMLKLRTRNVARSLIGYRVKAGTCKACSLNSDRTANNTGRQILRHFDEVYVDGVKAYRGGFLYKKPCANRGYGSSHCSQKRMTGTK